MACLLAPGRCFGSGSSDFNGQESCRRKKVFSLFPLAPAAINIGWVYKYLKIQPNQATIHCCSKLKPFPHSFLTFHCFLMVLTQTWYIELKFSACSVSQKKQGKRARRGAQIWCLYVCIIPMYETSLVVPFEVQIGLWNRPEARGVADKVVRLAFGLGLGTAFVLAAASGSLPSLFTNDKSVLTAVTIIFPWWVLDQPLSAQLVLTCTWEDCSFKFWMAVNCSLAIKVCKNHTFHTNCC